MPTLGWWRAGVRVPAPAPPAAPCSASIGDNTEIQPPQPSSASLLSGAAAPWLSAMNHEAAGGRNYELTNYNILHDSTWGGGQGAADRLRALLAPAPPLLLPAVPPSPLPMARENRASSGQTEEKRAASRGELREMTAAGLFKVRSAQTLGFSFLPVPAPHFLQDL